MAVGLRCRYFISENVRGTGTFRWSGPAVEAGRVHYKNRPGVSMLKISNSHKDDNGTYTCTYEPTGEQARIDLIIIGRSCHQSRSRNSCAWLHTSPQCTHPL